MDESDVKITIGSPDGPEIVPGIFRTKQVLKNVTVEILEDIETGRLIWSWYRQKTTKEIGSPEERDEDE